MAECSSNIKWACSACTYLNYETSIKCTLCHNSRNRPLMIEEAAASISGIAVEHDDDDDDDTLLDDKTSVIERWPCPVCTYLNCLRTKKCVQCFTDRPLRYEKNFEIPNAKHQVESVISRALNKWTCLTCTFDNWPNALRCTMCGLNKSANSTQEAGSSGYDVDNDVMEGLTRSFTVSKIENMAKSEQYTSALDIYIRRFAANDQIESLFFKAASNIGRGDLETVNSVIEYLINEGNVQRSFSSFESRLLNAHGIFRICFEPGDCLIKIAKKCDCSDLVKLMKRVSSTDERLPCVINCASRTRIYTKIAQILAIRNGGLNAQFIAHPYNFNIIKFPMLATDFNVEIMKIMMKPAPSIPPTFVFVDCYDTQNSSSNVVGRPPNFLMKNRGGSYSVCDAIFQTMFGVCDRFNILRAALKYTMIRSSHLFKPRWKDQCVRMARDCGLTLNIEDLDNDWDEAINAITNEGECLEPIHIWALSHVVCRPIIVVSTNDSIELNDLEILELKQKKKRQCLNHIFEGIYLPIFWGSVSVLPVTQSPLIVAFRNGLFHAVIVSDGYYQRDSEIHRFLKIHHSRRYGDNFFRFLTMSELNNSNFIAQFIRLGVCNENSITIRRDPHPFLYESLLFYSNWVNAIHCCDIENTGELKISQLEQNIESSFDLSHLCYSDKFSIFSSKAINVLKRNDQSMAESSASEPVVLDSEEEDDDDEEFCR